MDEQQRAGRVVDGEFAWRVMYEWERRLREHVQRLSTEASARAERLAEVLPAAIEAMECAMEIMEDGGLDCASPVPCRHDEGDGPCVYSALKDSAAALAAYREAG